MAAGYIDSHVHVWPQGFPPDELLRHARPAGVERIVLIQPGQFRFDNSYMLQALVDFKGTFSAVAVVDPAGADPAAAMRSLARSGARGFRIVPGADPAGWLDAAGMRAMWKCGAEERLAMCPLVNPDALDSIDRACVRHPDTRVVIDHLARIGAGGKPILDAEIRKLCALARHRNVFVKVSAFYALGRREPPYTDLTGLIRQVVEHFGPRRLMWGSDAPYQVAPPHSYRASVDLVTRHLQFLTEEDRKWILKNTAETVFF